MILIALNGLSTEKGLCNNSSIQSLKRIIKEQLLQLPQPVFWFFAHTESQLVTEISQGN